MASDRTIRGPQQFVGGRHDHRDADAVHAVRHMAAASFGGKPDLTARSAWEIHSKDARVFRERTVAPRVRWAEQRDDGRPHCGGQMHRPGVAGDEQIEIAQQRGERRQVAPRRRR